VATELEIIEYISSLNLEPKSQLDLVFNKLLLLEPDTFNNIIDILVKGKATADQLLSLEEINDNTISEFIYRILSGSDNISDALDVFNMNLDNLGFQDFQQSLLNNYDQYIYAKMKNATEYLFPLEIDERDMTKFSTFGEVILKHNEIVSSSRSLLETTKKLENFVPKSEKFIRNPEVEMIISNALDYPLFVGGYTNWKNIAMEPFYPNSQFILNELYLYFDPTVLTDMKNLIIQKGILTKISNGENPTVDGREIIQEEIYNNPWEIIESPLGYNFNKLKLLHYYLPVFYGMLSEEEKLIEQEIIDDYINYFSLARNILIKIKNLDHTKLVP
jgi:hypothetical protein